MLVANANQRRRSRRLSHNASHPRLKPLNPPLQFRDLIPNSAHVLYRIGGRRFPARTGAGAFDFVMVEPEFAVGIVGKGIGHAQHMVLMRRRLLRTMPCAPALASV